MLLGPQAISESGLYQSLSPYRIVYIIQRLAGPVNCIFSNTTLWSVCLAYFARGYVYIIQFLDGEIKRIFLDPKLHKPPYLSDDIGISQGAVFLNKKNQL